MTEARPKVVAVLSDLLFTVKIGEAAKRAGLEAVFVQSRERAIEEAKKQPALIILDLNEARVNALALLSELKTDPDTSPVQLLGYVSHVQTDVRQAALAAGCDTVLARSAFVGNLPALFAQVSRSGE